MEKQKSSFDFRSIKSFEDACARLGLDPNSLPDVSMIPQDLRKDLLATYRLYIICRAVNNGWIADFTNHNQKKYYPWLWVRSAGSGFDFSHSGCGCSDADTAVGSRLCTFSSEAALYIASQFEQEYKDTFLIHE